VATDAPAGVAVAVGAALGSSSGEVLAPVSAASSAPAASDCIRRCRYVLSNASSEGERAIIRSVASVSRALAVKAPRLSVASAPAHGCANFHGECNGDVFGDNAVGAVADRARTTSWSWLTCFCRSDTVRRISGGASVIGVPVASESFLFSPKCSRGNGGISCIRQFRGTGSLEELGSWTGELVGSAAAADRAEPGASHSR